MPIMHPMIDYFARTTRGRVGIRTAPETRETHEPVLLFLHGAFRRIDDLTPLAERFSNIAYGYLPGHQMPELDQPTMAAWISAFSDAVGLFKAPVVAVGESLGGVLAMGMRNTAAAVAFDPFLRTAHLWPLKLTLQYAEENSLPWLSARAILSSDADFSSLLTVRARYLDVLAGDEPLMPPRTRATPPSLLDEHDEVVLKRYGAVRRVPGGHDLVKQNLAACEDAVRRALASVAKA